jgi:glycosyltransferase involved in cell wall biosynthesis
MNLVVISHKETWRDPTSPCGYATVGGFPFQMQAISSLFNQTRLMVPIQSTPLPTGAIHLTGHNLQVVPLAEPSGAEWRRKINMSSWFLRHIKLLWREVARADAVHTPVGGDIGTIGIFVALAQRKPLFVRHCGTWGQPISWVDNLLQRLLELIAGRRNVVMATGGDSSPPSKRNPHISWIFSTTLSKRELEHIPPAEVWVPGMPLRLITVGRLSESKNVQSLLQALPLIQQKLPETFLDILGEGEYRSTLEALSANLGLTEYVTFHGNRSHAEVMKALMRSHLFVFPTLREGFPKAVTEALACGLPVIATRTSAIPEILRNGGGILLEDTSASAIARAVLKAASDPVELVKMGLRARRTAQSYTLEAWGVIIEDRLKSAWTPMATGEHWSF